MTPSRPNFGRVAGRYDELRPTDENWWEVFELLVREGDLVGRRVLDIGCGTGRAAAALAERGSRVWGVEPEPEMAARARERLSTVKVAPAERLPFKDGWFERALMRLVSTSSIGHGRSARPGACWRRTDGSRSSPSHWDYFDGHWLNRFFPSLESIDRAQFLKPDDLVRRASRRPASRLGVAHAPRPAGLVNRESAVERVRERLSPRSSSWTRTSSEPDSGAWSRSCRTRSSTRSSGSSRSPTRRRTDLETPCC